MPLLNGALQLHDVRDVEHLCANVLHAHLRKTRAALSRTDFESALSYLIATCWEISEQYDPNRDKATSKGRQPTFSNYAYSILSMRVVDWRRSEQLDTRVQVSAQHRKRTPAEIAQRTAIARPASLDIPNDEQDGGQQYPPAPEHEHTGLEFALRTRRGDPTADCDPDLARHLRADARQADRDLNLLRQAAPRRAA